jgi:predicted GNAT family acetyltransferase
MPAHQLRRLDNAAQFRALAEPFLLRNEAQNNLALGLASLLEINPNAYGSEPYFAVVANAGEVVATALMTPPERLVLSFCLEPDVLRTIASDVYAFLPRTAGVMAPAPTAEAFAAVWQDLTGEETSLFLAERVYRLERVRPPAGVSGRMRRISPADRELLLEWYAAFESEALGHTSTEDDLARMVDRLLAGPPERRGAFLWEDPAPACLVAYGGPTPNSMRIGPVYTPPTARRRGYASACTAEASAWLLANGRAFLTLFTDLANPTSNAIYQAIGYEPVCDVDAYDFIPKRE